MAILKFTYEDASVVREAYEIELKFPDDIDIFEYKRICKRLASALGYSQKSIEKILTKD